MTAAEKFEASRGRPILLSFKSVESVVVVADDEDRFVMTAQAAARACKTADDDNKKWTEEFREFLKYLHDRCEELAADISACYLGVSDEGLRVFMTAKGGQYNRNIADKITDIDLDLASKFPKFPLDCIQIPSEPVESLTSFFSMSESILVYGDRSRTPKKGE